MVNKLHSNFSSLTLSFCRVEGGERMEKKKNTMYGPLGKNWTRMLTYLSCIMFSPGQGVFSPVTIKRTLCLTFQRLGVVILIDTFLQRIKKKDQQDKQVLSPWFHHKWVNKPIFNWVLKVIRDCFTLFCYWSRKLASLSQPISYKTNTNHDLIPCAH